MLISNNACVEYRLSCIGFLLFFGTIQAGNEKRVSNSSFASLKPKQWQEDRIRNDGFTDHRWFHLSCFLRPTESETSSSRWRRLPASFVCVATLHWVCDRDEYGTPSRLREGKFSEAGESCLYGNENGRQVLVHCRFKACPHRLQYEIGIPLMFAGAPSFLTPSSTRALKKILHELRGKTSLTNHRH
jgi:hypothetical protein